MRARKNVSEWVAQAFLCRAYSLDFFALGKSRRECLFHHSASFPCLRMRWGDELLDPRSRWRFPERSLASLFPSRDRGEPFCGYIRLTMSVSIDPSAPLTANKSQPAATRGNWIDVALLAGILLLACFLRVTNFDAELSFDELWHLATTPGNGLPLGKVPADVLLPGLQSQTSLEHAASFWRVWTGMDGVLHPPLYCLSLRIWREAFGQSDFIAHLYSTFWSLLAIGFLFATARLAMDRWAAALVTLGTCVSQVQIYFAQEVRSYQMLVAIGTAALWLMTLIEMRGPTRLRALALAVITLPLLLTHYFAAGAVISIGAYGMIRLRGHRLAFIIACAVAGAIYFVTWVPFALQQIDDLYTGDSFLHVAQFDLVRELLLMCCAPWRTIIDKDYRVEQMSLLCGVLFIVPWFLIRRLRALLPWAIWLLGSIGAVAVLDVLRSTAHLTFPRYFAVASPAVLLLAVGIAWSLDRRSGYIWGGALVALIAVTGRIEERMSVDSPFHSDARNVVRDRIGPDEAVLIYPADSPPDYADMIALTLAHDRTFRSRPTVKMLEPMSAEIASRLPERAWVFAGGFFPLATTIPGATILEEPINIKDQALLLHIQIRRPAAPTSSPVPTSH